MIKWTDISNELQLAILTSQFPANTSNGRVRYNDVDSVLKGYIDNNSFGAPTLNGRLRFHDLNSSLQTLITTARFTPQGYAGYNGTTGGAGGSTTTVSTAAAFNTAVSGSTAKIIYVDTDLNIGYQQIGSNKTIIGINAPLLTGTCRIEGKTNVILRNLTMTAPAVSGNDQDGCGINNSTNVWVDHCTVYDWTDGAIDITNGSDFVTVSWCRFYQTTDYYHPLVNLVGASSTAGATDTGKLHVTFHHNWWDVNCKDRMPRVRFGRADVYNNYYKSLSPTIASISSYITAAIDSEILASNNFFKNGEDPFYKYPSENGLINAVGNYIDGSVTNVNVYTDSVFTPPYSKTLNTAASIEAIVLAGAGSHTIT